MCILLVLITYVPSSYCLNSSQLNPFALKHQKILSRIMHLTIPRPFFQATVSSRSPSLSCYFDHKDEQETPGHITKHWSFTLIRDFPFLLLFYRSLRLSLSLSLSLFTYGCSCSRFTPENRELILYQSR